MTLSEPDESRPSPPDAERLAALAEDVVRPSFRVCCDDGDEFFDDFYATLSERAPGIGAMFAHVDMQQQNRLIRRGVEHLIDFALGSAESAEELRRVARTHGRQGLNVAPELYALWVDTLMETIRIHDPHANDDVEAAWRVVLRGGLDLIIAGY